MKDLFPLIEPHVITNKKGKELGVFIEIKDYKLLLDYIENLSLVTIARSITDKREKRKTLEEVRKEFEKLKH